jgi:L-rhamnose isomerase/sugar isomerase
MIQTAMTAQELFAKACLVDRKKLADAQAKTDIMTAEGCLKDAFATDVRPMLAQWRKKKGLDPDPLKAFVASGYEATAAKERTAARAAAGVKSTGSSYA